MTDQPDVNLDTSPLLRNLGLEAILNKFDAVMPGNCALGRTMTTEAGSATAETGLDNPD